MRKMNIENKIKKINSKLIFPKEISGTFLPSGYKKQYKFMFLAEMPSQQEPKNGLKKEDNFNITKRDKLLQNTMIKYGVAGSYITDIVKSRDMARQPFKKEVEKYRDFLLKEIEIINPEIIVVLGKRTYEESFFKYIKSYINKSIICDYVFHCSSQVPKNKFINRFKKVINKYIN